MTKSNLIRVTRDAIRSSPREIFNWYVLVCTCIWSFSGVSKGFDEGKIASLVVMRTFETRFNLDKLSDKQYANTKGWIVSIATAGAVFGCLSCVKLSKRSGRKFTFQASTLVYIVGVLGQAFSGGSLSGLYAPRFIGGMGIGAMSVLAPVFISEISPAPIRRLLELQYISCQVLEVVFGFFFNYSITKHYAGRQLQWQLPTLLQIVPAVILGVGSIFFPESPRYLQSTNKQSQSLSVLATCRQLPESHPYVQNEFQGMQAHIEQETEAVAGTSMFDLVKETFATLPDRRRFFLMFLTHVFSQWSGANAITQYSPTIFAYLGIEDGEQNFLATGLYGIVKFVSTLLCSTFLIDFLRRRSSLMTGIALQIITLVFLAAYLGATNGRTATENPIQFSITECKHGSHRRHLPPRIRMVDRIAQHSVSLVIRGIPRSHTLIQRLHFDGISLGVLFRLFTGHAVAPCCHKSLRRVCLLWKNVQHVAAVRLACNAGDVWKVAGVLGQAV